MSLSDDLTRNRKIFEQLANIAENTDLSPQPSRRQAVSTPVAEAGYERAQFMAPDTIQQKYRSFSLKNGESTATREVGFTSSFEAPESISYPRLSIAGSGISNPDPLEGFYWQLEAEARRSSQLSREEEY